MTIHSVPCGFLDELNWQDTQDFELLRDFIWEKSGMYFESTKQQYFLRRLHSRMDILGCQRLKDYHRILKYGNAKDELLELLNVLTTTETYFFRNAPQLQSFEEEVIPDILKRRRRAGESELRIWSAGSSSGEEPYTLAMMLLDSVPDIQDWKITIIGTDINTQVLAKAKEGMYSSRSFRETPEKYKAKYFTAEGESYRIADDVRRMVTFLPGNLMKTEDMSFIRNVDCIFCRNVLIYFHLDSCKKVVNMFYDTLVRNGYLLLGHSESLYRITAIFKLVKLQHSLVYYKE